jgi:membrane protein DedA with SNARE-associated domain
MMPSPVFGAVFGGLGIGACVALLIPMEAGAPIPIPDDLVMLLIGAGAAAGDFPWWVAVVGLEVVAVAGTCLLFFASRAAGYTLLTRYGARVGVTTSRLERVESLIDRRGRVMLMIGRGTPGLRTVTGGVAGASGTPARRALPPLLLGATVFAQLHFVLGAALGPLARDAFDQAKGIATLALVALLGLAAVYWIVRKGRRRAIEGWDEAACPVCLGLAEVVQRALGDDALTLNADQEHA